MTAILRGTAFLDYVRARHFPKTSIRLFALGTILITVVLAHAAWESNANPNWIIWAPMMVVLVLLSTHFKLRPQPQRNIIFGFDFAIGFMWLTAVLILGGTGYRDFLIFVTVLLFGAALLSAVNLYSFRLSSLAVIGIALPVFAVTITGDHKLLAVLCVAVWLCVIGLAWGLHKAFLSRLALMFEKEGLLQNIEDKMVELEQLREQEARSRREAEAANQAKSRFLAHSSHDLRQPLHAMGLLLETIPEKGLNLRSGHIIDRVKQSLDSLSGLFDSLLDVAMLDTGQIEVNTSVFSVGEVLQQITQDYEELARSQNVDLTYVPTKLLIETDRVILHRMVQNLVSNAIKHAGGGRVLVGMRRLENEVNIAVYDTGCGIVEEDQIRIFDEFTKLEDKASDQALPGLGLGLSIVQRLARIIDVRISLRSEVNVGSAFRIEGLKRSELPRSDLTQKKSSISKRVLDDIRISIIDDDVEVLQATKQIVEKWGYIVDTYTYVKDVNITCPDIILCDYQLGLNVTGIEAIQIIRERYDAPIPAIIITANTSKSVAVEAKNNKLPILYKPVKPAQLRSILLTILPEARP